MTTRRILLGLALLATTLLACAGTASAKFYNDGSVLPMLRPAFVTHAQAVAAAKKKSKKCRAPLIGARPGGGAGGASGVIGPTTGVAGCDPNFSDPTVDSDKDLLSDVREHQIGTDPCSKDSDADGVEDGYEYYSAVDL